MFLSLDFSWFESLGNNSIFVIYNILDSFELKIKLSIVIMPLWYPIEQGKFCCFLIVVSPLSRKFYGACVLALLRAACRLFFQQPALWVKWLFNNKSHYWSYFAKHVLNQLNIFMSYARQVGFQIQIFYTRFSCFRDCAQTLRLILSKFKENN